MSIPDLKEWVPKEENIYFRLDEKVVIAEYSKLFGIDQDSKLSIFLINKDHYVKKMDDILHHMNYFLTFYDEDHETFISMMSVKYIVDRNPNLSKKSFRRLIMDRIMTPSAIEKLKKMAKDLYTLNIDTDREVKFKSTPKITNDQARQIVTASFCFRLIIPLCVHFSHINENFVGKTDYIACFISIFLKIIQRLEKNDVPFFSAIYRFTEYRVKRFANSDKGIWKQKKQLYGITEEIYLENLVHEVIIVKNIHKLDYSRSCVSFIDGIVSYYNGNYVRENYKSKPFEISAEDSYSDDDDYLSHAEALEMSIYKLDESNAMINDTNTKLVMKNIENQLGVYVSDEEMDFYMEHIKINSIIQFLLHSFYSRIFKNNYSVYILNRKDTVRLIVCMKKYLQSKGMVFLPQACTARIKGKFKNSSIKNSRFIEKFESSSVYKNIILKKYRFVYELDPKDDKILKRLSNIVNSTFVFVDPDPDIHMVEYTDIDVNVTVEEFMLFLSII